MSDSNGLNGDWDHAAAQPDMDCKKIERNSNYPLDSGIKDTGTPNAYPCAVNTPLDAPCVSKKEPAQYPMNSHNVLDRAYLRPLQQPLFDTEIFVPGKFTKDLSFFCRPVDQNYQEVEEQKTIHDTCLNQSKMLDYPLEFSILGFNVIIDSKATPDDRNALLSGGLFQFQIGGRNYLKVPLENVCARQTSEVSISKLIAECMLETKGVRITEDERKEHLKHVAFGGVKVSTPKTDKENSDSVECLRSFYKFNLGKCALKLKAGEEFNCILSWKKSPFVSKPVKIITELIGLKWTPM